MFKLTEHLKKDVKDFIEEVARKTKGYDVYLGGGFIRDLYYNYINYEKGWSSFLTSYLEPKDIDLFFIPNDEEQKELPVLPKTYINYDIPAEDIPNVRENVKHVRGLFVKYLSTRDVQFIIYDKPMTMKELAEDMDISINQCMYHIKGSLSYMTDGFTIAHEDKIIEMMHDFEPERMYNRLVRMSNKFPDYKLKHNISKEDWEWFTILNESKPKKRSGSTGSFIEE